MKLSVVSKILREVIEAPDKDSRLVVKDREIEVTRDTPAQKKGQKKDDIDES